MSVNGEAKRRGNLILVSLRAQRGNFMPAIVIASAAWQSHKKDEILF